MTEINITNDKLITIAKAKSHSSLNWKNETLKLSDFIKKLNNPHRTAETVEQFKNMDKPIKDKIKNCIGGFVGGALKKDGQRTNSNIKNRILLTLDIDNCFGDIEDYLKELNCFYLIYSTHSHRADYQRYRLILPLDREVNSIEYEAIGRMQASKLDKSMKMFDDTTYEPCRLMYWASIPKDAGYYFEYNDASFLKVDDILNEYFLGYEDISSWPRSERETNKIKSDIEKQQDPLSKKGIIGEFCRTYTIQDVINEYLSDVYSLSGDSRATYIKGSTDNGVVIYADKFSFSHHGTDPASYILCNAWDLVRIHKFGILDEGIRSNTKATKLPSFIEMRKLVSADTNVIETQKNERLEEVKEEFGEDIIPEEIDDSWKSKLTRNDSGYAKTVGNFKLIIENDFLLKGKLRYDVFGLKLNVVAQLPWRNKNNREDWGDTDDSGLIEFIEKQYGIKSRPDIDDALKNILERASYHPVKEYIESILWDGEKRAETIFIDYLGAEDNEYSRLVALKILVGAVKRIYEPGCKFELIPILQGGQGNGKSTMVEKLGGKWFTSLDDGILLLKGKELSENTQGAWITEWAEYGANKKKDSKIKSMTSKNSDLYRPAYGRRSIEVPRRYIMIATTNNFELLTDITGDRRFLPLQVNIIAPKKDIFDNNDFMIHFSDEVQQIWAEVYYLYKNGYKAYLNADEYKMIDKYKEPFRATDVIYDDFVNYMEKPVTENWYELKTDERIILLYGDTSDNSIQESERIQRYKVCVHSIYDEFIVQKYSTTFSSIKEVLYGELFYPLKVKLFNLEKACLKAN